MTPLLRKLLGLNWLLLVNMLALAIFGVVAIYSATYMREESVAAEFWRKQANWVAVGFLAFMITSLIDYRWVRWGALPMYLAGLFFLILTKFIGTKVYGSRSWLHLGPINFQPAQLAVIAGIMVLALFSESNSARCIRCCGWRSAAHRRRACLADPDAARPGR
jgi:rod shape determining protein RodA